QSHAAHGAGIVAENAAPCGKDTVAEKQDILSGQPERSIETDGLENRAADDHAGEMEEAPVLEHDACEIGKFDKERRIAEADAAFGFLQRGHSEMIVEFLARLHRGPIAIRIEARHAFMS